ncbi:hypothetical protein MHU86_25826 [Fragilaria crotonensis]|nr:hypothetical protein MHU86_25826 [Fragilaria crotonensis]
MLFFVVVSAHLMLKGMDPLQGCDVLTTRIAIKEDKITKPSSGTSLKVHPQFVFLVGTEGSGHHLWYSLIEKSPNVQRLKNLGLLQAAIGVTVQLYSKHNLDKSLFAGPACDANWNATYLVEQTAHKLRLVATTLPPNLAVPLNGLPGTHYESGMISYPNFRRPAHCGDFRHPDLRLLEQACQDAQVSCHIILQYRDPLATLRSTTIKRRLHTVGYAIALYTAMYQTVTMQLSALPVSSLQCCWDSSDAHPPAQLGILLGHTTDEEFRIEFAKNFIPSSSTNLTRADVIPPHLDMSFDGMLAAFNQLKAKCLEMQGA